MDTQLQKLRRKADLVKSDELKTCEDKLAFYDEIIATNDKFKRLGKTMPYTAANTHMFTLLNKAGEIGMRLSKEDGEQFMKEHNTTIYKSYGAVMKSFQFMTLSGYQKCNRHFTYPP